MGVARPEIMERLASLMPVGPGDLGIHHGARRAARRYPLSADVELVDPEGGTGVVINVSSGGLRIALDRSLPVGELCVIRVRPSDREYVEHARVVWRHEYPDGWVLGLAFVDAH